jgi:hypothetical protein
MRVISRLDYKLISLAFLTTLSAFLIFSSSIAASEDFSYYRLEFNLSEDGPVFIDVSIELTDNIIENPMGFNIAKVLDSNEEEMSITFFGIPDPYTYYHISPYELNFTVYVPYHDDGNEIVFYDENMKEFLSIDVSGLGAAGNESPNHQAGDDASDMRTGKQDFSQIIVYVSALIFIAILLLYTLRRIKIVERKNRTRNF